MLNFFKKVKQRKITRDQFAFLPNGLRLVNTSQRPLKARGNVIIVEKAQSCEITLMHSAEDNMRHVVFVLAVSYVMSDGFAEGAKPMMYGTRLPKMIQKSILEKAQEWWTKNGVKPDSDSAIFAQKLKELSDYLSNHKTLLAGTFYSKLDAIEFALIENKIQQTVTSKGLIEMPLKVQTA